LDNLKSRLSPFADHQEDYPMTKASREFQVFAKPTGSACNLECRYCYYVGKEGLYGNGGSFRMSDDVLENYIIQHLRAALTPAVRFSWHGGEPTVLGIDYFRKIVALQRTHQSPGQRISNGIQTNGTLLDEDWCRFLSAEGFSVGISLDGPEELHDHYRVSKRNAPTHIQAMRGYELLRRYGIPCDVLCVVHDKNVHYPAEVYQFFKGIGATHIGFLPLVQRVNDGRLGATESSVPALAFGDFLCAVFDEWLKEDIERINVQVFEEAIAAASGREHALCIFRKTCGDIPVIEHNGDFFPCDHFVDPEHRFGNIGETSLAELLESRPQRAFGRAKAESLPRFCKVCNVLDMCNGGCPKDRFLSTADGEKGLNYLCEGYKRFFAHCRPFVSQVAALWQRQRSPGETARRDARIGRNDPCPCGSGRKYKKCCMRK
jgi:uncharacterized protein